MGRFRNREAERLNCYDFYKMTGINSLLFWELGIEYEYSRCGNSGFRRYRNNTMTRRVECGTQQRETPGAGSVFAGSI
jgi:hypothetical protein